MRRAQYYKDVTLTSKRIGLLIGNEWSFPAAFAHEVERRRQGVRVEMVQMTGTRLAEHSPYHVIIDRISQDVPYYRTFLKNSVLAGTTVINNPFWNSTNDRFFNASLVTRMGFAHPRVVALPAAYQEQLEEEALRNLKMPIPWSDYIDFLGGFPVVMRPVRDTGVGTLVYIINSLDELYRAYEQTREEPMMLREHISWDKYIRCICIGSNHIMPLPYTPGFAHGSRYQRHPGYLTAAEHDLLAQTAQRINYALGYDINAIDFAFRDGELIAVDVTNPVPDFDVNTLTPYLFDNVVQAMADFVVTLTNNPARQHADMRWGSELGAIIEGESGGESPKRQRLPAPALQSKHLPSRIGRTRRHPRKVY